MQPSPALAELCRRLQLAAVDGTLVKLTLGTYRGQDPSLRKVFARPVELPAGRQLQFVYRHATKDVTKNLPVPAALDQVTRLLTTDFRSAHLFTTGLTAEWKPDAARLKLGKPRHAAPADRRHDRAKHRLVDPRSPWLTALDASPDKLRQIDKFVEILAGLAAGLPDRVQLTDMGCGKGYLTFAAYDWLRGHGRPETTATGIETRPELVDLCNRVARDHHLTGLRFEAGTIESANLTQTDVLVALHACDTATDEALAKGIQAEARVIIVAPCCHQEVRSQLVPPAPLAGALRHGILLERQAEFITDALRAALLEWAGYDTKVFEFISTEHTAKNLMITAVKHPRPADSNEAARRVRELARCYGIRRQRLADRLDFAL